MRTGVDPAERTLLGGALLKQFMRVEITNASGTWIDYSSWVTASSIHESIDQPVASASVTFAAQHGALSLHPLRSDSALNVDDASAYAPAIHGGRRIRISEGNGTPNAASPGYGWHPVFEGIVEEPDATDDGKLITVAARDLGALLLDRIIETERNYDDAVGLDLEVLMQRILNDNATGLGVSATVVLSGGSPNWRITKHEQLRVPLLDALRTLAQQKGWDIRFRWNGDDPELQLYEPDRAKTAPDFTLPPSEYLSLESLKFGDSGVRNVVRVKYQDATTNVIHAVQVQDVSSIFIYGRRFIEVVEGESSTIDSVVEATDMANAMLSDLATPFVDHIVTSLDLWFAELGDLVEFPANSVHYDQDQAFAIVALTRTWSDGVGKLQLRTRGKPAGAYSDWIKKHGRGPDGSPLPAPYFGIPIGEDSEGGGVSGDGMVWMELGFEPNTRTVVIYVEEKVDLPVRVPEVGTLTEAWRLSRPPGRFAQYGRETNLTGIVRAPKGTLSIPTNKSKSLAAVANAPDWRTFVGMATRPFYYKRVRAWGINWQGVTGPEFISDAVRAQDVAAIIDGVVDALTLAVGNGSITVHVDVGTTDHNHESFLCIMRNGLVIVPQYIGVQSGRRWTFVDDLLDTALPYTYEAFIWTKGVTGVHVVANTSGSPGPTPPATPALNTIVWVDPTPKVVSVGGVLHVAAQYIHNAPWATKVALQASPDGGAPWADAMLRQTTAASGQFEYPNLVPNWYRFRAANADDSTQAFSIERHLTHGSAPTPPVDVVRIVNGTPKLNAAGTDIQIDYQVTRTGTDHVALFRSLDGIAWGEVDSSATLIGTFLYSDLDAAYFQVVAHDAAHVPLAASDVEYWNGGTVIALDSPPVILPGSPDVIDVLGVPHIRVSYDSNISWFARMSLQSSADGLTWSTVMSDVNPGGVFLYNSAVPQWFRVRAENTNDTLRLHSASVWFAGNSPPGGVDTTAPDLSLSVQNVGGVPALIGSWTCDNAQAVRVTIDKSPNGTSGWAEVNDSGAVSSGQWTGGDPLEEAYYRAQAWNLSDQLLATSTVEYWAGQIFVA